MEYYFYLAVLFMIVASILGLYTLSMIKKDITGPIITLKKSIELNLNQNAN